MKYGALKAAIGHALAAPVQEPVAMPRDAIVVNLLREGINKHRARELADHFISLTTPPAQPAPVPLTEMAKILVDRLAEEQAVYLSMETAKSFAKSMLAHHGITKGQP
jgi:hypothetical protein